MGSPGPPPPLDPPLIMTHQSLGKYWKLLPATLTPFSNTFFSFCRCFTLVEIEVTSWLVSADDFSSRVARGANERVSAANE